MSRTIRGANSQAAQSLEPEVILAGPANSGKTFALLIKLHRYAMENPRVRILMLRSTRESMNETTLETWESEIYPKALLRRSALKRRTRKSYSYPNGSRVILAGMDDPEKIKGSRYDIIYVNEATDLTEEEWEICASRLLHKRGPYRQIIGDCNPPREGEEHWVWKRHQSGACSLYFSEHKFNPAFTDEDYKRLSSLRGENNRRFFQGSWKAMPVGSIFQADWFKYIDAFPRCDKWVRYWDIASGTSDSADYTVGVLMGRMADGRFVIADIKRGRWGPNERNEIIRQTAESDSKLGTQNFFEKGFGAGTDMTMSVIKHLAGYSIHAVKAKGDKLFRADPLAAQCEAGQVYIVRKGLITDLDAKEEINFDTRNQHSWISTFVLECCNFTGEDSTGKTKDDQVDAAVGAFIQLARGAR